MKDGLTERFGCNLFLVDSIDEFNESMDAVHRMTSKGFIFIESSFQRKLESELFNQDRNEK